MNLDKTYEERRSRLVDALDCVLRQEPSTEALSPKARQKLTEVFLHAFEVDVRNRFRAEVVEKVQEAMKLRLPPLVLVATVLEALGMKEDDVDEAFSRRTILRP